MQDMKYVEQRLDRLYAELAELKRHVIIHWPAERARNRRAWKDLMDASAAISSLWTGPGAVDEIRAQREK